MDRAHVECTGGVPRELIPRLVEGPEADEIYVGDIAIGATFRGGSAAGKRFESLEGMRLHGRTGDVRPGAYDPDARIVDMDADGVAAEVVYPTTALHMYHKIHDAALLGAILAVYNDWIAEFCGAYPHRLRGLAMIVLDNEIEAAARRTAALRQIRPGGGCHPRLPHARRVLRRPQVRPVLGRGRGAGHAAESAPGHEPAGNIHRAQGVVRPRRAHRAGPGERRELGAPNPVPPHLLRRARTLPGLRFVQLEHELGWIPFFMDRIDYVYRERPMMIIHRFADGSVPTDYLHRNVYHSFQEDALGMRDRGIIGVDNLLWGSDYPHLESTFPGRGGDPGPGDGGGKRRRPGADDLGQIRPSCTGSRGGA